MRKQLLLLLFLTISRLSFADSVEIDGIYYNLFEKGNIAEVAQNPQKYTGTVDIPEFIVFEGTQYKVTAICSKAFYDCKELLSVSIPVSITEIGTMAFQGCDYLNSVRIFDLEAFCQISGTKPLNYHLYLNDIELTDIVIPDKVTTIKGGCFRGCAWIKSVTIHEKCTEIGDDAFRGCTNLSSIKIPNSVIKIGSSAFMDCSSLSTIELPNGISQIDEYTFFSCTQLKSIEIPNTVKYIWSRAFENCSKLETVILPNNLEYLYSNTFMGCVSLKAIVIPDNTFAVSSCGSCFEGCLQLKEITLGKKVSSIGDRAFANCPQIEHVYSYAESVPIIDSNSFIDSYINFATLHVPAYLLEKYKTADVWKDFGTIIAFENESGEKPQCAKPIINYSNGQLTFTCETEGAEFISEIKVADIGNYYDATISLKATYDISVYATKSGNNNSEIATATLCWIDAEPKTEGITNGIANVRANPVLIQSFGNVLSISGVDVGTPISVYDMSGKQVGSANVTSESTFINTSLARDQIGIVKIGEKAVKITIK